MNARWVLLAVVAAAFSAGGILGELQFRQVYHADNLCLTCHHGGVDPHAPPTIHSADYFSLCHVCHVLPVKQYLSLPSMALGEPLPAWIEGMTNPLVAQQSCLECHMMRGRGNISCEACHVNGDRFPRTGEACTTCHLSHPALVPHGGLPCEGCHPMAVLEPRNHASEKESQP